MDRKGMIGRQKGIIFYIWIISLVTQVVLMAIISRPYLSGDEPDYDSIAVNLASGHGFSLDSTAPSVDRTPGYPLFLALIYLLFGHNIFIAKIAQLIVNSLTCIAIYLLVKRIFGEKIAVYAAISVAIYPPLAAMSVSLYSEALFTFLFALSILLLRIAMEKERLTIFLFSGLIIALATHTHPVSVFFPLVVLITIPFFNKKRKSISKGIFCYFITFIIALSPWILRNYIVFHEFIPFSSKGGIVAWTGSYVPGKGYYDNPITKRALIATIARLKGVSFREDDLTDPVFINTMLASVTPKIDRYLAREALNSVVRHPFAFAALMPLKIIRLWTGSYSGIFNVGIPFAEFIRDVNLFKTHIFIFIFKSFIMLLSILIFLSACIGIFIERVKWRESILILLPLIYFAMFYSVLNAISRLGLPALPFLLVYSLCGILKLFSVREAYYEK